MGTLQSSRRSNYHYEVSGAFPSFFQIHIFIRLKASSTLETRTADNGFADIPACVLDIYQRLKA